MLVSEAGRKVFGPAEGHTEEESEGAGLRIILGVFFGLPRNRESELRVVDS